MPFNKQSYRVTSAEIENLSNETFQSLMDLLLKVGENPNIDISTNFDHKTKDQTIVIGKRTPAHA